jgi:hypothetical protein
MAEKYKQGGARALSRVPLAAPPKKPAKASDRGELSELRSRAASLRALCDLRSRTLSDISAQISAQQSENGLLLEKITDMTNFLADYGLYWRGGAGPQFSAFPDGPRDMGAFQRRIRELNALAGSAPVFRLAFHDEGFTVNDGELRKYGDPASGSFLRDIVDGFFPSEFRAKFPNGIKFQVDDRRTGELFQGRCRRLEDSAEAEKEENLGKGDGKLKVRMLEGGDLLLRIEPGTKVRAVRRIVQRKAGLEEFELSSPPSTLNLDDNATMASIGLYPRGVIAVKR